jgi:hypothetical protein
MNTLRTLYARPQLRALAALLLLAATLALALVVAAPAASAALAALALAGGALLWAGAAAGRPAAQARPAPRFEGEAPAPVRLTLPSGAVVAARPVEVGGEGAGRLLLTRDGYVVVNAAGQVIHRL